LKFLRKIDRETPKGKTLHLIADITTKNPSHSSGPRARDILQKVIRANSRLSFKQNATLH
jgi:hypothetical protein